MMLDASSFSETANSFCWKPSTVWLPAGSRSKSGDMVPDSGETTRRIIAIRAKLHSSSSLELSVARAVDNKGSATRRFVSPLVLFAGGTNSRLAGDAPMLEDADDNALGPRRGPSTRGAQRATVDSFSSR
jgi:hypothetical protein